MLNVQVLSEFKRLSGPEDQQKALLGPLFELLGGWSGSKGWNVISMPSPGSKPEDEGKFIALVQPYYEKITFAPIGGAVRNRGGDEDQFIGGVTYELSVADLDTDETLHVENGMWLNLATIKTVPGDENATPPQFRIARTASIPHGDSLLLLGNSIETASAPRFGDGVPPADVNPTNIGHPKLRGYTETLRIPMVQKGLNPSDMNLQLKKDIDGLNITRTTTLSVDSRNGGGILNVPFVKDRAHATRIQSTFWIETVCDESGLEFLQLQYNQITDIDFHKPFGGGEGLIVWPHGNINTLRKQ